jgi:hypothetical protein
MASLRIRQPRSKIATKQLQVLIYGKTVQVELGTGQLPITGLTKHLERISFHLGSFWFATYVRTT